PLRRKREGEFEPGLTSRTRKSGSIKSQLGARHEPLVGLPARNGFGLLDAAGRIYEQAQTDLERIATAIRFFVATHQALQTLARTLACVLGKHGPIDLDVHDEP